MLSQKKLDITLEDICLKINIIKILQKIDILLNKKKIRWFLSDKIHFESPILAHFEVCIFFTHRLLQFSWSMFIFGQKSCYFDPPK